MAEYHQLPPPKKKHNNDAKNQQQEEEWNNLMDQAETFTKLLKETAEVPTLNHLSRADYWNVYEPSDDTFLLLDAIHYDFHHDSSSGGGGGAITDDSCLIGCEIGCGTGVATIYLAQCLQQTTSCFRCYMTDINPKALDVAKRTAEANGLVCSVQQKGGKVNDDNEHENENENDNHNNDDETTQQQLFTVQCDLASDLLPRLEHQVDVLLFNPPYVPTPNDEVVEAGTNEGGIEASWAGGDRGRLVIDRALPQIARLLKKEQQPKNDLKDETDNDRKCRGGSGVALMIVVDDNDPFEIASYMFDKYGIRVIPYVRRRARNEYLTVLKMFYP